MAEEKIKVVHIITSLGYGGAERVLLDLARFIDHKRFDLQVLTVVEGGPLIEKLKSIPVKVSLICKKTRLGFGAWLALYRKLKAIKPQIVHTHLFAGDFWGGLAAWAAGVPVIVSTKHNIDVDEGRFKRLVRRLIAPIFSSIAAVSNAVKDYTVWVEKVAAGKVEVIYNGVKIEKFLDPSPKLMLGPEAKIAIVGRLAPQKGHKILFHAMSVMRNRHSILKVVGEGPLRNSLEKLAKSFKISPRVEFVGVRTDMSKYIKHVDIVVLPSLWEGLGLVLIEASLAGRVIVASEVGGIPEVVVNGETGLLVPAGNAIALAEALDWLIEHPVEARQMGLKAQQYAKRFDVNKMVAEYQQLYDRLMDKI